MKTAFLDTWTESEAGWGKKDDGGSIHSTKEGYKSYVEEYWGEELDEISCNGSTGGFILEDLGLNNLSKTQTKPYFKFQDLLDVYRNNGDTYDESGRVVKKGNIMLSFDIGSYYGYFDNFNYSEAGDVPFRFVFDFIFKVERSYLGI